MKNLFTTLLVCLTFAGYSQITLVKDIYPGSNTSAIDHITATDYGYMLMIARSGTADGVELWRSDGTAANTYQIKDIYPGSNPSYPLVYHDLGGGITGMRASNGTNGYEPWTTDGTEAGTQMIKDVYVGSSNSVPLTTNGFAWGTTGTGIHLIPLSDGITNNGTELWKTDGTSAGTVMVKDIYVGTGSSGPKEFTEVGNKVAFTAYSGTEARELYISVYKYNNDQGGTFDICVWEPNIADNDFCANAFPLTAGVTCTMQEYSNGNATSTEDALTPNPGCGFYQGGDVWFTVEMPASGHLIVDSQAGTNNRPVVAVYTGTCGLLALYDCDDSSNDNNITGEVTIHDESLAGEVLYIRVYKYNSEDGGTFNICASEVPCPDNDFCSFAEPLTVEAGFCNYSEYTNEFATATEDLIVPSPVCGFYQGSDVWFELTVPASGEMIIDLNPDGNVKPSLALYTGTCESLSLYDCDNSSSDNGSFVGKLIINDVGLAGQVVYVRIWTYNSVDGGTFGICAYDPSACAIGDISVGTQTSCSPSTNFYTQEVTFEYINEPVTGTVLLNGQSFSIDGSAQTVVLTDLYSDLAPVDLAISFSDAPGCTANVASAWIAAEQCCSGDLNGDQIVNASDLLIFLGDFGCSVDCAYDITGDGAVDTEDLLLFLGNFGQICP